ncbi:MAG: TnsA endonuclease N-terminal domain-containing protein [Nanoarchaeota archaeon]
MPTSERGEFEESKKSPYNFEYYDSSWELELMKDLEKDPETKKWTKNHGIAIPYRDEDGKPRGFKPDFLIEKVDGTIELIEIKGRHLLPQFKRKHEAAIEWCKSRKMTFRVITKY